MKSSNTEITSVDQYISMFPEEVRSILFELRSVIKAAVPRAKEKISYKMPAFYNNGYLVYFAAFKKHIGFYPTSGPISAFQEELKDYKHAKGSVQFPIDKPIPLDLVKRMVEFRAKEILLRQKKDK